MSNFFCGREYHTLAERVVVNGRESNRVMQELSLELREREQDLTEKIEAVSCELWCSEPRSEGSETGLIGVGSEGFAETDLAKCCPCNQSNVFYIEPL